MTPPWSRSIPVTSDLILTEPADITPYQQLYTRLRDAALTPADSLKLLTNAAAPQPLPSQADQPHASDSHQPA